MRAHVWVLAAAFLVAGAQARAEDSAAHGRISKESAASQVDADDTGKNVRDRDGETLTPGDQSNKKEDVDMTAKIRKAVVADDSLSTTAQNVKIITIDGQVTLRGPVKSDEEKAKIAAKAEEIAGVGKVTNQLEVAAN